MSIDRRGVPPTDFMPDLGRNIEITKPTIAAVRGIAYAGGWRLMQMCDLCVAGSLARFAITEVLVGRGMAWAAPMVHLMPPRVFLELIMTGKPITAHRAYELGFVNRVVDDADVMAESHVLAQTIVAGAPLVAAAAKKMLHAAMGVTADTGLRAAEAIFEPVYESEDAKEGPLAFKEKRKPNWRGS